MDLTGYQLQTLCSARLPTVAIGIVSTRSIRIQTVEVRSVADVFCVI